MVHEAGKKYINYRFPGQKDNEQIRLLVRKHWIIDVKISAIFIFTFFIPAIAVAGAAVYFWTGEFTDNFLYILLLFELYALFMMLITYEKWQNEELDLIIVTNERIVSHDQIDLFHRQISETSIAQVQDVKGIEKGFWGNMFHYGSLEIQTAARDIVFVIQNVKDPYQSARYILDIRERYIDKEKFERAPNSKNAYTPIYNI